MLSVAGSGSAAESSTATSAVRAAGRLFLHPDARFVQIGILTSLLAFQMSVFDFGATPLQLIFTVSGALLAQVLYSRVTAVGFDWRSSLITGLSLTLLLRSHEPSIWFLAGFLGISSKFLLRFRGKQIFNPACFAIVALLLAAPGVWVSPGIWGSAVWFAVMLAALGCMVLSRAARVDTALSFIVFFGGLLLARAFMLGDPLTIPLHQFQSGSLLIFSLFMITDPRSTPDSRPGRMLFAAAVALIAYRLQFVWQVREALFYALAAAAPLTPLIDTLLGGTRFRWRSAQEN